MDKRQVYLHQDDTPLPKKAGAFSAVGTSELANLAMPGTPTSLPAASPATTRTVPEKVLVRRRRWPVVLLCLLAMLLAFGFLLFFFFSSRAEIRRQEEYATLLQRICASRTPAEAAVYRPQLDAFVTQNPDVADPDLETLLATCETYVAAADSEEKFTDAVVCLSQLSSSPIDRIAACADAMLLAVYRDYNRYLQTAGGASGPASQIVNPGATAEMPLYVEDLATLGYADGQEGFSITARNTSGKTITYIEVVLFCYDGTGSALPGANGYNWEWVYDYVTLQPDEQHTPEVHNYWAFTNCANVEIGVPFINYVRFADGTEWGFTTPGMAIDEGFVAKLSLFRQSCDQLARQYAAARQRMAAEAALPLSCAAATPFPQKAAACVAPALPFSAGGFSHTSSRKTFVLPTFPP